MRQHSASSRSCPVCGSRSVTRNEGTWGLRSPLFHCPDCGSNLKTTFTWQVLWAFPVCMATFGATYLLLLWLRESLHLQGVLYAAFTGGLIGGSAGLSMKVATRGIVYRQWEH